MHAAGDPSSIEAPEEDTSQHADHGVAAGAARYTVSVRALCEFTAKRGDLDRRFSPSATAIEGLNGQAAVVARRGAGYDSELALEATCGELRVRGRADGYDRARGCLEEIKTIRGEPEQIPENRRQLHWAQLETYGAMLCRQEGRREIELALIYVDAASQREVALRRTRSAAELGTEFESRCAAFVGWARQEAEHRSARDRALEQLAFPLGEFRAGQRALAEAVYRTAIHGRCLLAQAPTGIGKTLGTLFPMLRAMPVQKLDKLAYLTCKGTGRGPALDALERLRDPGAPGAIRVVAMVAMEQACEHRDKACHGDSCPLASGFYDRLPAARAEAVRQGWLDPESQRRIALAHDVCPYYLGQELVRWADVVVADVHHAFDPNGHLLAQAGALDWNLALLVDEAHNLVDRARRMYSASLAIDQVRAARDIAPAPLRPRFDRVLRAFERVVATQSRAYQVHDEVPVALAEALQALLVELGEHVQSEPLATGALLDFYLAAIGFQRLAERFGNHSIVDVELADAGDASGSAPVATTSGTAGGAGRPSRLLPGLADHADATLTIRNVVPGAFLRARFAACRSATLFSATLGSERYQRDMLGLPANTGWLDIDPPFDAANLTVRIADRLSTRYPHRAASLDGVVDLIAQQCAREPGNYLAFFSSFEYLEQAAARLGERHPEIPQWQQARSMEGAGRKQFLERFRPEGRGVGFAVLGGSFAEGVDLPGTRLIGAFIATLGLPPVSAIQEQFRVRLDELFGSGHGYADLVPGIQKVIQAGGRVIRSPEDRGWLWLMDGRYRRPEVLALLPAWWQPQQRVAAGAARP